jgi:fatty-acyl-CoA synthase
LHEHPAVASSAVLGIPDEKWGEVGRAIVVKKAGAQVSEDELLSFCRDRMAKYKAPKSVIFVDVMPLTAAGKISKVDLRKDYAR